MYMVPVSIPQSGFGAFEPRAPAGFFVADSLFQSLSRDSGRLNRLGALLGPRAFFGFQSLSRDSGRLNGIKARFTPSAKASFNPSVGIRGV